MKNPKKILIIIQRSNGDVFLSLSLINALYDHYHFPLIDLLVNDDTLTVAKLLPHINFIHKFSYQKKRGMTFLTALGMLLNRGWNQEKEIITNIYRKYDLSINLTASDRSVIYSILASNKSISAIENEAIKSWWKKILLNKFYYFDKSKHILLNNLEPLRLLKIKQNFVQQTPKISEEIYVNLKSKLAKKGINNFIIFHPSAQYKYKIYPKHLRDELLLYLSTLDIPILITGSNNEIDTEIKQELPSLSNVYDMIGETSLAEYFVLSEMALAYIGVDTLNMHIAAGQNKPIFAIFGPTNLSMWSPWSNVLKSSTNTNTPKQTYGNITIFQADMPCVACGEAGCANTGKSECLGKISPERIFHEIKDWYQNAKF